MAAAMGGGALEYSGVRERRELKLHRHSEPE